MEGSRELGFHRSRPFTSHRSGNPRIGEIPYRKGLPFNADNGYLPCARPSPRQASLVPFFSPEDPREESLFVDGIESRTGDLRAELGSSIVMMMVSGAVGVVSEIRVRLPSDERIPLRHNLLSFGLIQNNATWFRKSRIDFRDCVKPEAPRWARPAQVGPFCFLAETLSADDTFNGVLI